MKETEQFHQDTIRTEQPAQIKKAEQFLRRKPLKKGQNLYEFNFREDTIKLAELTKLNIISFEKAAARKKIKFSLGAKKFVNIENNPSKVVLKPNCLYIPALNVTNAIRHIHNKISTEYNPKIIE